MNFPVKTDSELMRYDRLLRASIKVCLSIYNLKTNGSLCDELDENRWLTMSYRRNDVKAFLAWRRDNIGLQFLCKLLGLCGRVKSLIKFKQKELIFKAFFSNLFFSKLFFKPFFLNKSEKRKISQFVLISFIAFDKLKNRPK